jgi:hypothetical protein
MQAAPVDARPTDVVSVTQVLIVAASLCLVVPLLLGIISLMGFQLYLAATNTTTIENHERSFAERRARRSGKVRAQPIDSCGRGRTGRPAIAPVVFAPSLTDR